MWVFDSLIYFTTLYQFMIMNVTLARTRKKAMVHFCQVLYRYFRGMTEEDLEKFSRVSLSWIGNQFRDLNAGMTILRQGWYYCRT